MKQIPLRCVLPGRFLRLLLLHSRPHIVDDGVGVVGVDKGMQGTRTILIPV